MNLEIHTKTSLFRPFNVDWLLNVNGQYFAITNNGIFLVCIFVHGNV